MNPKSNPNLPKAATLERICLKSPQSEVIESAKTLLIRVEAINNKPSGYSTTSSPRSTSSPGATPSPSPAPSRSNSVSSSVEDDLIRPFPRDIEFPRELKHKNVVTMNVQKSEKRVDEGSSGLGQPEGSE